MSTLSLDLRINTELAGHTIGKGGQRITEIRKDTGASLKIEKEEVRNLRGTFIGGTREQIIQCIQWIFEDRDEKHGDTLVEVLVPSAVIGSLIGKQGSSVAEIRESSGAKVTIQRTPPGPQDPVRIVEVAGTYASVRQALAIMLVKMEEEGDLANVGPPGAASARRAAMTSARSFVPPEYAAGFHAGRQLPAMAWGGAYVGWGPDYAYGPCGGALMHHPSYSAVAGRNAPYNGGYAPSMGGMPMQGGGAPDAGKLGGILCFGCSNQVAGRLIGKGGAVITEIRKASGARFKVEESSRPDAGERLVSIDGNQGEVESCVAKVFEVLDDSYLDNDRKEALGDNLEVVVLLPDKHAGAVIGRGGENIQAIRSRTNARVKLLPDANRGAERQLTVGGAVSDVMEAVMGVAQTLFKEVM